MQQETITTYSINELSDKPKQRALKIVREMYQDEDGYFLRESLTDSLGFLLKKHKIEGDWNIQYSLSNCQGDGVSFVGRGEWKGWDVAIKSASRYVHERSTSIELSKDYEAKYASEKQIEAFKKLYYKICQTLEKEGYAINEGQYDEKYVIERANESGLQFFENGVSVPR